MLVVVVVDGVPYYLLLTEEVLEETIQFDYEEDQSFLVVSNTDAYSPHHRHYC